MKNEIGITESETGETEFRVILHDVDVTDSILGVRFIADKDEVIYASLLIKPETTIVCSTLCFLDKDVEVTLGNDADNKTTLWLGDEQVDMDDTIVQVGVFPEEGIAYLGMLDGVDLEGVKYSFLEG